jgi:hypothetical protein
MSALSCSKKGINDQSSLNNSEREMLTSQDRVEQQDATKEIIEQVTETKSESVNEKETETVETAIHNFLIEYFLDNDYTLLEEPFYVGDHIIYFAVHYIEGAYSRKMFDRAVGFEVIEGNFYRYLLIQDFQFINEDNSILTDFSEGYAGVYGFNITYSYPRVEGYNPGLIISVYFDKGKRVADDFTIRWNEDNKCFIDSE